MCPLQGLIWSMKALGQQLSQWEQSSCSWQSFAMSCGQLMRTLSDQSSHRDTNQANGSTCATFLQLLTR